MDIAGPVSIFASDLIGALRTARPGVSTSILTLTIASVIPGPAQQEPGISQPSPLDSGFAPSGAPRNDGGTKRQKHKASGDHGHPRRDPGGLA